jgi:hypothetical protein
VHKQSFEHFFGGNQITNCIHTQLCPEYMFRSLRMYQSILPLKVKPLLPIKSCIFYVQSQYKLLLILIYIFLKGYPFSLTRIYSRSGLTML